MSDQSFPWGTTFPFDITVTLGGDPVDLTGKKLILLAKYRKTDPDDDAVIALSSESGEGIEFTDPDGGIARATITPAMTTTEVSPGRDTTLHYAVRLIDGSNSYDVESGLLHVLAATVRATS